jgi:uncharacterized membrane protein YgdD (TMEM256/DUF423 family)
VKAKKVIYYLVVFVILFSLSIYLLATNNLTFDFKVIGFVTPIGGTLLIVLGRIIFPLLKKKQQRG